MKHFPTFIIAIVVCILVYVPATLADELYFDDMDLGKPAKEDDGVIKTVSKNISCGVYWSKTRLAGKEPSDNPRVWVAEAVDRSGITGWLFDLNGMVEKVSRGAIGANALTGGPTLSRYAVRNAVGSVLGPTFGLGEDAFRVAGAAATGELKRSDIRAARRLLPYQNLWYIRGLLNALEDETAEELELKGR